MLGGMTMSKIAVTVPGPLVARVKRAVRRGAARSVSAYVTRALEEQTRNDDLRALLDEMLAHTGGPLTPAERRAAERDLTLGTARKKRAR